MTNVWYAIGFLAQFLFGWRFILQWYRSERAGRVVIPISFWRISLAATFIQLAYSIHIEDPVFIFGGCLQVALFSRNLVLGKKTFQPSLANGNR